MTRRETAPTIVVGYDGSDASRAAVEYAGERASPDGTVFVVYAYGPPPEWLGYREYNRVAADHQARGREMLESLMDDRASLPAANYVPELLEGPPAEAIARVAEARRAGEAVVGSRGLGKVRGALGSVSHALIGLAQQPVVVIPPDWRKR